LVRGGSIAFSRLCHGGITTDVVASVRQVGEPSSINGYRIDGTACSGIALKRTP
jgi:hypothetical protein